MKPKKLNCVCIIFEPWKWNPDNKQNKIKLFLISLFKLLSFFDLEPVFHVKIIIHKSILFKVYYIVYILQKNKNKQVLQKMFAVQRKLIKVITHRN